MCCRCGFKTGAPSGEKRRRWDLPATRSPASTSRPPSCRVLTLRHSHAFSRTSYSRHMSPTFWTNIRWAAQCHLTNRAYVRYHRYPWCEVQCRRSESEVTSRCQARGTPMKLKPYVQWFLSPWENRWTREARLVQRSTVLTRWDVTVTVMTLCLTVTNVVVVIKREAKLSDSNTIFYWPLLVWIVAFFINIFNFYICISMHFCNK